MTAVTAPRAAAPGESTMLRTQVSERVRQAVSSGVPLRIVGRRTWLDAGRPVRASMELDIGALRGIVEYTPGDLTLTALAGTSLAEIATVTRAEGQWLALDPMGGDAGSIGATIATGCAGPLAQSAGTPRDNVLGLEVVTGTGETVHAGGRVVKNVAGFDLVRLNTGAWGTLGVITEVTVRLRALPAVDETLAIAMPVDARRAAALLRSLREAPLQPLALELASASLARRLGLGDQQVVIVRLGGNEELVRAQRLTLAGLGEAVPAPATTWTRLREPEPHDAITARVSAPVSRLGELWTTTAAAAEGAGGWAHASAGRGVVRVVLPAASPGEALRAARAAAHVLVPERMPEALWSELAPPVASDTLSRGVRRAFDPHRVLNPGILGDHAA